jgi:hypothetical protein
MPSFTAAHHDRIDFEAKPPPAMQARRLREQGFAVLGPQALAALCGHSPVDLGNALAPFWERLTPDAHLKDGGRYRLRRHGCYLHESAGHRFEAVPHRAHWQPTTYNALHGGMERWFDPIELAMATQPAWGDLITSIGKLFAEAAAASPPRWYIETHPFRIDTRDGVGRPTPEGAHRDGVDFVAVILVARHGIKGGETRVFEAEGPRGVRFTLTQPWSALLLDDPRVIHESTPIVPLDEARTGHRDTLVLTYRAGGFQAPSIDATPAPDSCATPQPCAQA